MSVDSFFSIKMFIVLVDNGATQFRLIDLTGELIREFTAETGGTTNMLNESPSGAAYL